MTTTQVRVGSCDPGGQQNAFAFLLTQVDRSKKKIYVLGAKGWHFEDGQIDYPTVESELAVIHSKYKLSFFVVEQNNTGLHVVQTMRREHHIPTHSVTSANRIKDKKIISKGETMDKKEHVGWINSQRKLGNILFPKQRTDGIRTLESQLDSFTRHITKAGTTTFLAESGDDDFVMAFMVNTFFIRKKLFGDAGITKHTIITKSFTPENMGDELGSGIPPNSQLIEKETISPIGMARWRIH